MRNLPESVREALEGKRYDVVIGIPSYNNAETIGFVAEQAAKGIMEHFPDMRAIIVNSDGGSADDTQEAFMKADTGAVYKLTFQYEGIPGKGSALRAIFELVSIVEAKYCALLDSDLRSVRPFWIKNLIEPLTQGYDYVVPMYLRHKFDGTITNNIAYPMTASLYGLNIRQPIGGDFGFSGKLAKHWVERDDFDENTAKFGIDIWMTTTAINEFGKVAQASLGVKVHDEKDPGASLGPMFFQVVGTLFKLMGTYKERWVKVRGLEEIEVLGDAPQEKPKPIEVDLERLKQKYSEGLRANRETYARVLGEDVFRRLDEVSSGAPLSVELWYEVLARYSAEYQLSPSKELLDSLVPLYFGRTATALSELSQLSDDEAETRIREWAQEFVNLKDRLAEVWRERGILS